jgi:lipooligosaccharide transport system permease protein
MPAAVQAIARALPLHHGVALVRPLLAGEAPAGGWLHLGVLVAYAIVGFYAAMVLTRRRLLK